MKKNLLIIIVLLVIPIICFSQFYPTGGYQKGGHGSGGGLNGIFDEYLAKLTDQLWIYPNPTSALLTIESGIIRKCTIEISSLNSQLISSTKMEGTTHHIDLSSFQKGVYLITIRSKDFVTTRKIIKL